MPHDPPNSVLARRHEADGVNERVAAFVAIGIVAVVWLSVVCVWLQFRSSEGARYRGLGRASLAGLQNQPSKVMPAPQLAITPGAELAQLRAREDAELTNYAWIDRSNHVVQIPIARAMELIVQRGLPATGGTKSEYQLILERSSDRKLAPMKEVK